MHEDLPLSGFGNVDHLLDNIIGILVFHEDEQCAVVVVCAVASAHLTMKHAH